MYTRDSLRALLEAYDTPVHEWGQGKAKTLEHLLTELSEGESKLKKVLLRFSQGAGVYVYYQTPEKLLRLREKEQIYTDGRRRVRDDVTFSVAEKMKVGEDPLVAAYRALKEELGIFTELPLTFTGIEKKGPVFSGSFPGLISLFEVHAYELFLPNEWYQPDGYIERQTDKTSYFHWIEVPPDTPRR